MKVQATRTLMLAILASLLLFTQEVLSQDATVTGATMTWYGVYTVGDSKEVSDGTRREAKGISPPRANTDRIPIVANTRFGFGYEVVGSPSNATVNLRYVYKMPPPGMHDDA